MSSIPYHSIHVGAQVDDGITHVGYLVDPDGLTGGGSSLDGILTAGASAGLRAIVGTSNTLYPYQLVAGTDAEASPLVIRPDDYATTTNEKVWKLQSLATAGVLVNGATQPASLAGGIAWASGTAPSADVADQVSLWVGDRDGVAGRAALQVRSENGFLYQLGDRLALVSPNASSAGSQVAISNNGVGMLSMLVFAANHANIAFGAEYNGSDWIARHTTSNVFIGGTAGLVFYSNSGLTVGNPFTPTERLAFQSDGLLLMRGASDASGNPGSNSTLLWSSSALGGSPAYRSSGAAEGAGQTNRVHNRTEQVNGSGTDYTLTNAFAQVVFGTTSPSQALPTAGTYQVDAIALIEADGAAGVGDVIQVKLRNTTDGADVSQVIQFTTPSNGALFAIPIQSAPGIAAGKTIQVWAVNTTAARGKVLASGTSVRFTRMH